MADETEQLNVQLKIPRTFARRRSLFSDTLRKLPEEIGERLGRAARFKTGIGEQLLGTRKRPTALRKLPEAIGETLASIPRGIKEDVRSATKAALQKTTLDELIRGELPLFKPEERKRLQALKRLLFQAENIEEIKREASKLTTLDEVLRGELPFFSKKQRQFLDEIKEDFLTSQGTEAFRKLIKKFK